MNTNYRKKIYPEYASRMQDASPVFNKNEAVRWGKAYDTYLRGWLPDRKNAAVLDVGCGGGNLLYFFRSREYRNVKGIDISHEQINLARQVHDDVVETDNIKFLESQENKYDLIIGLDIVEHYQKDEVLRFLEACYNALNSGGCLILQTPNAESPWGTHHRYHDFTHEIGFNPNSLKRLISLVGLSDIEFREAGPVVHGIVSLLRYLIWKVIHICLLLWNLVETGSKGSGIYTRVFLIKGKKI
ncbi:MAG: class I SAM-dependent methyltransferase [Candidatus Hodarchaeota archaeon]